MMYKSNSVTLFTAQSYKLAFILFLLLSGVIAIAFLITLKGNNFDIRPRAASNIGNNQGDSSTADIQEIIEEGVLEIEHTDNFEQKTSKTYYFLNTQDERLEIVTPKELEVTSGSRVKLKGKKSNAKFELTQFSPTISATDSATQNVEVVESAAVSATGNKKIAVILVNFLNKTTTTPTIANAAAFINGQNHNFYAENSFAKLNLTGDVYGWYTLPINMTCDYSLIRNEAIKIADPAVNFANYQLIMYVFPTSSFGGCGWVGVGTIGNGPNKTTADGIFNYPDSWIDAAYFTLRTVSHELGHNFTGRHANGYECGTKTMGGPTDTCTSLEYFDQWDALGGYDPFHFNAYHKQLFGWFNSPNIINIDQPGRYTLYPLQLTSQLPQMLYINIGFGNYYFVENRSKTGFDLNLPASAVEGAVVHLKTFVSGGDTQLLDNHPQLGNYDFQDSGLSLGQTFTDSYRGISVSAVSKVNNALTLDVSIPVYSNLTANLTATQAAFTFSYPGPNSGFRVDVSTDPTMTNTNYPNFYPSFATGVTSPLVVNDPQKWTSYACGQTVYWRITNTYKGIYSPIQTAKVNCTLGFSNLSANLTPTQAQFTFSYSGISASYQVDVSTWAVFSQNVYTNFASGTASPIVELNPKKWASYNCGWIYFRIRAADGTTSASTPAYINGGICPTPTPFPTPTPVPFSNLNATLAIPGAAVFYFNHPGSATFTVDVSRDPLLSTANPSAYLNFISGATSPLIETNPKKWKYFSDKYSDLYPDYYVCGKTVYWRIKGATGGYSPIQATVTKCGSATDDFASLISYTGSWTTASGNYSFYQGTSHLSSTVNSAATFPFTGTQLTLLTRKASNFGKAEVWIDGSFKSAIDLYSSVTALSYPIVIPGLSNAAHSAQLKVLGTKNSLSTSANVAFDGFRADTITTSTSPSLQLFNPVADTYVHSSYPFQNYGTSSILKVDGGDPVQIAYLKFDLTSLAGKSVKSAKLRLFVTNSSSHNQTVVKLTSTWDEKTVTYNNRPVGNEIVASIIPYTPSGKWKELDITQTVTSSRGQLLSLMIMAGQAQTDGMDFYSRESTAKPQLEVNLN